MTSVSVVLPTFNRASFLRDAIASVFTQTRPPEELIIVDDGSTDGTPQLVNFYLNHPCRPRVTYIRQSNRGPAAARNTGIAKSQCDVVAFLDDDDVWHPQKTERQLAVLQMRPDVALLGCGTDLVRGRENGKVIPIGVVDLLWRNRLLTPSVMARRSVLVEAGGFAEDLRHAEDYELWLRIASKKPCALLDERLVSCGHGKAPFGESGLSWDLTSMAKGEQEALARWYKTQGASAAVYQIAVVIAHLRAQRRKWISKLRGRRSH